MYMSEEVGVCTCLKKTGKSSCDGETWGKAYDK